MYLDESDRPSWIPPDLGPRYYILKHRKPIPVDDMLVWARYFEKAHRKVRVTMVGDIRVSTFFLGLDHSLGGPEPLIFETMIFGGPNNYEMDRCSTWRQALKMHWDMVEKVKHDRL